MPDDALSAVLTSKRAVLMEATADPSDATVTDMLFRTGLAASVADSALKAVDAALRHHERLPLYGNAATEEEPGNCPHDPDSHLHFEADDWSGEWLCEGKPEGVVCSCTESSDGEQIPWPCDEVKAILAALTGGESPHA